MKDFIKEQLQHKSDKVLELLESVDDENFYELKYNILNAKSLLEKKESSNKPLIVSLLGGTKAGKSHIFNEMHRVKLSETSDDVGACTQKLIVSCEENQRAWAPAVKTDDIVFKEGIYSIPEIMFIDTPDIDSNLESNRKLAFEAIKISDIVIFVTTPDKKYDFSIWDFLQKWADKKRWYFVLNKAENVTEEELATIRTKIGKEIINKYGFNNSTEDFEKYFYALKGREKNQDPEFLKLKKAVFQDKSSEKIEALHDHEKLNAFAIASSDAFKATITSKINKINSENQRLESKYEARVKEFENDTFLKEEAKSCFIFHFCKTMCERNALVVAPYFALTQMLYTNKNEETLNKRLADGIENDCRIQRLYSEEKEIAEREGFNSAANQANNSLMVIDNHISIAQEAVKYAKSWQWTLLIFFVNLAPISIFGMFIYHTIADWLEGKWLPSDFFIHGLVALILTSILGYWLMWLFLSGKCKSFDSIITSEADEENEFKHFMVLKTAKNRLEDINHAVIDLTENAKIWRDAIQIPEHFGMETKRK